MSNFALRAAEESDYPFIYSTWLKGLRYGWDYRGELYRKDKNGEFLKVDIIGLYSRIDSGSYFRNYHKIIEIILHRPDTGILVACLPDDPTTILGYAILGKDMVHYVHVKSAFRRFGIAKALCPEKIHRVTHVTKMGWNILREKHPNSIYDPFL